MKNKDRLDNILFNLGYFESKSKAQAAILAGNVKIDGKKITKAGTQILADIELNIEVEKMPYVSRGGFKLEKAVKAFDFSLKDKICLDAGASTGGFVDCMLQNGAKKVYAVDVGYGQLSWKLRSNPDVVVVERTNIRYAEVSSIYSDIDDLKQENYAQLATMDLSFISITKVLENIKNLLIPSEYEMICLIKPQFEAGREEVPKSGVIKDKNVHVNVIKNILDYACTISLFPVDLTYSPIKGPAGNIEYLVYFSDKNNELSDEKIKMVVDEAYEQL